MAHNGLQWTLKNLPLAAGLQQRTDDRARPEPFLDICRDVQFDEIGGLQTRLPFGASAGAIFGGGTIANARRIVPYGNELVLFTKDTLYSWNAQLSKWVSRGTHLAVKVDESQPFATTGDQIDADRAELAGSIVIAWTEGAQVYAAALDKTTGSVLVTPTAVSSAVGRPRLVALATKILLFTDVGTNTLTVRSIDPATPGTAISGAGTVIASLLTNFNAFYDVVKVGAQDLCVGVARRGTTTSYEVFTVTPALVITTVTKARTADGPVAVSTIPDGTKTQVVRGNGTNIQGDFLTTSTLADVTTGQAIGTAGGTPVNQIAACHRSVQNGGAFRCYAFWSAQQSASFGTLFATKFNFVDSAGAIGAQATFVNGLAPASRAFDYNGSVYLWMEFGQNSEFAGDVALANVTQAQNAYLLYRDDAFFAAKAVYGAGGGLRPSNGLLPGVALTSGSATFSWMGTAKRRISVGGGSTGYAARSPRDVACTFDSNEARRCARIGSTLYIAAGEILQYDGIRLTEVGFHFYPWSFDVLKSGAGSVASGEYAYKVTWRSANGKGEVDRSTTATIGKATMAGGPAGFVMGTLAPLNATHKTTPAGAIAGEVWRTPVNPDADTGLFLATSNDPANLTNPNKFIPNDPTAAFEPPVAWRDEMADAVLVTKEENPENGAVLENLVPPGASIIAATDVRLFLGGVAGDPDRVWPSKLRGAGEVAAFHDTLPFDVPRDGGRMTTVFVQDETVYVGRETALYAFAGVGLDNLGQGQNFTLARIVSSDVGVTSHDAQALTPLGTLFKSNKGWQLLSGGNLTYVGGPVSDFDGEAVLSIDVVETQHQVRILTASRMLVWAYPRPDFPGGGQWAEWTITDGVHSCMHGGAQVYLTATGTRTQLATYTGVDYGRDAETAWIKLADLQAATRCRKFQLLGENRGSNLERIRVAYNYDPTYVDDRVWTPSPTTVGGPLQVSQSPKRPKCEAIKIRFTACAAGAMAQLHTAALSHAVLTTSTPWAALINAAPPGELGNAVTMSLAFEDGSAPVVDVREHLAWDHAQQLWVSVPNNVGIRVQGSPTIVALELAIQLSALSLIQDFDTSDSSGATVDAAAMRNLTTTGSFSGGTFVAPAGESHKLTGLGLEVGIEPGLLMRLPPAQEL